MQQTICIVGDSFVFDYKDTYLEILCNSLNLKVLKQHGIKSASEYDIYRSFMTLVELSPDIILCSHTNYRRFYNPNYKVDLDMSLKDEIKAKTFNTTKQITDAADSYYKYLFDDVFAKDIQRLIINEMQDVCAKSNIKMINLCGFVNDHFDKKYGYWHKDLRLMQMSKLDNPNWVSQSVDHRSNHFSIEGHRKIASILLDEIAEYIR